MECCQQQKVYVRVCCIDTGRYNCTLSTVAYNTTVAFYLVTEGYEYLDVVVIDCRILSWMSNLKL